MAASTNTAGANRSFIGRSPKREKVVSGFSEVLTLELDGRIDPDAAVSLIQRIQFATQRLRGLGR